MAWHDDPDLPPPHATSSLTRAQRVVIGASLGALVPLVAVLVLRETLRPAWLLPGPLPPTHSPQVVSMPPPPEPAATSAPRVAEAPQAPAAPAAATVSAAPGASAIPAASASASASGQAQARRPPGAPPWNGGAAPGDPPVVELPSDFQYHPSDPNSLAVPASSH